MPLSRDAENALELIRQSRVGVQNKVDLAMFAGWGDTIPGWRLAQAALNELEAAGAIRKDGERWKAVDSA